MEPSRQPISRWVPRSSSVQRKDHAMPSSSAAQPPITAAPDPKAKTLQTPHRSRSMAAWSRLRASSTLNKSATRRPPTATQPLTRPTTWRTFRPKSAARTKSSTESTRRSDRMEASASALCPAAPEATSPQRQAVLQTKLAASLSKIK